MPTRGKTVKTETSSATTLLRPMITRRYELVVDHERCCGCKLCELVCPQESISLSAPELEEGRVKARPRVDIDDASCVYCGECVVVCPTHAFSLTVNGEAEIPVLRAEAFPALIRRVKVDEAVCSQSTEVAYIEECPVGAIQADVERDADGQVVAVGTVSVDRGLCISCTHCMQEGPRGGITVTKPYKGRAFLDTSLCPEGCQACADICPTMALVYDGEKVVLDERFCLYCGACENVCPVEGAVRIVRTGFVHTPVESGAWARALEKLVSFREAARELAVKGQAKRRKLVIEGLLAQPLGDGREGP